MKPESRQKLIGLLLLLVVAVAAGAVAVGWHRRSTARQAWASARPALPELKNWPAEFLQRIQKADAAAKTWPPDAAALGELARLYLANGFQREAEQSLRGLLVYDSQNPRWPHYLASVQAGFGQLDEAIELWRRVLELAPDYRPAKLKLAESLLKANRLEEARKAYEMVVGESPGEIYAELGLAQVNIRQGRWGEAREDLESSVKTDPLFSAGWALLATVADRLGDAGEARQAREKSTLLGRFRDVPDPWTDELVDFCYEVYRLEVTASTFAAAGENDRAVPILQRAIRLAPKDSRPRRQLGKIYQALHQNELAEEALQEAIALQPDDARAYIDLVNVERAQGKAAKALSLLKLAVEKCPNSDGLDLEMAAALMAANRTEEAIEYFKKAMVLVPDSPAVYEQLAKAQITLGRGDEAAQTLAVGLQRNPETPGMLISLARLEVEKGDAAAAEAHLSRAVKNEADLDPAQLSEVTQLFARKFGRNPRLDRSAR
jgi:predicted Zn-dependent protease